MYPEVNLEESSRSLEQSEHQVCGEGDCVPDVITLQSILYFFLPPSIHSPVRLHETRPRWNTVLTASGATARGERTSGGDLCRLGPWPVTQHIR